MTLSTDEIEQVRQLIAEAVDTGGGGGFPNPITAGNILLLSQLVLSGGVGTALLVYGPGTPAFGNLIVAIATVGGQDQFGNHYELGISFPPNDGTNHIAQLTQLGGTLSLIGPGDGTADGSTQINLYGASTGKAGSVRIFSGGAAFSAAAAIELFNNGSANPIFINGSLRINAGEAGLYYYEEMSLSGIVLTSGVTATLTPTATNKILSDYGSGWIGNLWTAPIDSIYTVSATAGNIGSAANRALLRLAVNGARMWEIDEGALPGTQHLTTGGRKYLFAGDTIQATALQTSGGNQTLDAQSYISIQREL